MAEFQREAKLLQPIQELLASFWSASHFSQTIDTKTQIALSVF